MIISQQILSIPPYLSTSWKNIVSLHADPDHELFKLTVSLSNGMRIVVPGLDKAAIDAIFEAHARYGSPHDPLPMPPGSFTFPLTGNGDLMNGAMQHNPAQSDSPEMPPEIIEKITSIAKVLGLSDESQIPKPEPHCNCPFCQIARAFHGKAEEEKIEFEIADADLKFRSWDIKQTGDKLFLVTNPLDDKEHYSVFLGEPLGCTCGQKNCEHIRAVLNS